MEAVAFAGTVFGLAETLAIRQRGPRRGHCLPIGAEMKCASVLVEMAGVAPATPARLQSCQRPP